MKIKINKKNLGKVLAKLDKCMFFDITTDYFTCGKENDEYYLKRKVNKYDIITEGNDINMIENTIKENNIINNIPDEFEADIIMYENLQFIKY